MVRLVLPVTCLCLLLIAACSRLPTPTASPSPTSAPPLPGPTMETPITPPASPEPARTEDPAATLAGQIEQALRDKRFDDLRPLIATNGVTACMPASDCGHFTPDGLIATLQQAVSNAQEIQVRPVTVITTGGCVSANMVGAVNLQMSLSPSPADPALAPLAQTWLAFRPSATGQMEWYAWIYRVRYRPELSLRCY